MKKITKYQKFEIETISREKIKNAAYNPRKIGANEAKALKKSIKVHGLVDTLIYNKRTGNLVGGHQRLAQLDALEGNKDYELTCAVIDVPLKQEKEINIILNNPSAQGEYDIEALKLLIPEINIDNTGFTDYDLSIMGVDEDIDAMEMSEEEVEARKEMQEIKDAAKDDDDDEDLEDEELDDEDDEDERIRKIKEAKAASLEKNVGKGETYFVVTFSSVEAKESFLDGIGHETDDRYVKGEILAKKLNIKMPDNDK